MQRTRNQIYEFGNFRLEPDERRLLQEGQPVSLTPKAFDTLVLLVERAGHLVEKEELMKALWPDSFVEEANLAQHIWMLRKTLGESDTTGRFIETVSRKGFRFVAPVTNYPSGEELETAEGDEKPAPASEPRLVQRRSRIPAILIIAGALGLIGYGFIKWMKRAPVASIKTIAVLPFKPLNTDSRNESLEMGMTETLITHLGNLKQIVVRPMSAVRKYSDPQQDPIKAGQELQVDAVVDGSIQKAGDRVRVTVRLTNVHDGSTLWIQQFDENFTDIFNVQDSISQRVANSLPLNLNGEDRQRLTKRYTDNPEAFELYLQAQYLWDNRTAENRKRMFAYYEQAIARDPNFALAYVGMADLQITLVGDNAEPFSKVEPDIRRNLAKALEIDPGLAQARNLLAEVKYQFDFEWAEAEKEFQKALELNTNVASIHLAYGWYLMTVGRFEEATREMGRAQELDPHSMVINRAKGRLLCYMRQPVQAIEHMRRVVDAEPNVPLNHSVLAAAYEQAGMYAQAVEEHSKAAILRGSEPGTIKKLQDTFNSSGWAGYLQAGRVEIMRGMNAGYVSPIICASINARIGRTDEAMACLEKAVDERAAGIPALKLDPVFDNLHSDPRFSKLLRRMNIAP
jgi:DNA-binding winged helix-turn-helix (wHTH) protein/TolB-like protein/Tfp pilus assembly protein PilF